MREERMERGVRGGEGENKDEGRGEKKDEVRDEARGEGKSSRDLNQPSN